jgi:hypothetical protein
MTDVIANLFVDVHPSKAKLTFFLAAITSELHPLSGCIPFRKGY